MLNLSQFEKHLAILTLGQYMCICTHSRTADKIYIYTSTCTCVCVCVCIQEHYCLTDPI